MKLLIAMMVFTSTSVFAADCAPSSAGDCKTQLACEKLNVGGKKVVEWRIQAPQQGQCMKVSVEDANTDCSSINSSSGAKGTQDSAPKAGPSTTRGV